MGKIIIANWKMNPISLDDALALAKAGDEKNVVVCPPFPFLEAVKAKLTQATLGAQDAFWEDEGPYTGEVSAAMLTGLGVRFVILGHSSRRRHLNETDGMVNRKILAALKNRLIPIICVGETKEEREGGKKEEVVTRQLTAAFAAIPRVIEKQPASFIVTYEPVWAISTELGARADTPEEALEMIHLVQSTLEALGYREHSHLIYGGSVTSANVESFIKYREIEGALVGGASLRADDIRKIINITQHYGE